MALQTRTISFRIFCLGLLGVLVGCLWSARGEIVLSDYSTNHPLKVMAIGDSITDDCSLNGAWRLYLQPMLETNGYPFTFVGRQASYVSGKFTKTRHEGYCGAVIAAPGMLDYSVHGYAGANVYLLRTIADALTNSALRPDLVLVVMGANDIGRGRDPLLVATNHMPRLLDLIWSNAPDANIILTKTTTLSNAVFGYITNGWRVPAYNAALQQVVQARRNAGQKVFLADMFSALDYYTMFTSDHLHPNQKGLNAMAKEFLARIQTITVRSDLAAATLIPSGASWRFSDTGEDLGNEWTRTDYDDSDWNQGPARLGYGDPVAATTLSFGSDPTNRNPAIYFRRSFVVPENVAYTNLSFRLSRSDGAVVWLNGQEAFRTNLPAGPIAYTNLALKRVSGEAAYVLYQTNLTTAPLPPGTNLVAVEIHASSSTNLSMGFDLELLATGFIIPPPALSATLTGGSLTLRWPSTNRGPYALYWTGDLGAATVWSLVSIPVQTNQDECAVEVPRGDAPRFFRLQKP